MIKFNEDGFTIDVKTGINPVETWLDTYESIIEVLQFVDKSLISEDCYFRIMSLVKEMVPESKIAKQMLK